MSESPPPSIATLLVTCPDRRGIVAALAQLLNGHGANILDADQHTDPVAGTFFQRIRFDRSELLTDTLSLQNAIGELAERFSMRWRISDSQQPKRVALFVSRTDHCLFDLLWRHRAGELRCEIPVIISNHPDLAPLAEQFGIDYRVFEITRDNKAQQEEAEIALLQSLDIDLIVLARYMQILSADFIDRFPARIINIHHSFLPAFMGGRPYQRAFERGVKLSGATAHYATTELDEGPIIDQDVVRATHRDSVADLVRKGRDIERTVLARAVREHLEDQILVYENKTVVFA
jgi:formyltetrahydrofolate deformylase